MSEHEDAIARAEQDADRLEERTDALGEQVEETRADWERKKADPAVPGAAGNPRAAEGGIAPEAVEAHGDARDAKPGDDPLD